MDRPRRRPLLILPVAALIGAALPAAVAPGDVPIRAARWLVPDQRLAMLTTAPAECLAPAADPDEAARIAIGRVAFRAPLLLGGQAARAGMSCNSCHRSGTGNAAFHFPGVSDAPGTADVTSSIMSSHRGDGIFNPKPIPDLTGPRAQLKIAQDPASRKLETFIHGLIVEEFDGPEPSAATLDGVVAYVRHLGSCAAPGGVEPVSVAGYIDDVERALHAAITTLHAGDRPTARLMLSSARSTLGLIDERFRDGGLARDEARIRTADRALGDFANALDDHPVETARGLERWLAHVEDWAAPLRRDAGRSLFDAGRLGRRLQG